jgi:hypothetical protein
MENNRTYRYHVIMVKAMKILGLIASYESQYDLIINNNLIITTHRVRTI